MDSVEHGRQLAVRHDDSNDDDAVLDPARCLLNYAEFSYEGDWTLRSGLMRLAQPHPEKVGSVLELSRRLDGPLHHVRRELERQVVITDRALDPKNLSASPIDPCPDIRTADLARLVFIGADNDELQTGYLAGGQEQAELGSKQWAALGQEERLAVPLLAVAVSFEKLAATIAAWALIGPADPPVDVVDRFIETTQARLDELNVPVETGPPPGMRRGGRG